MKHLIISKTIIFKVASIFLVLSSFGCEDLPNRPSSQGEDEARLKRLRDEITGLSESVPCSDEKNWRFMPIGSKACGGPTGFVSYSITIDTAAFKKKVEVYTEAEKQFNKKWGMISDCSLPPVPQGVKCENGKPVLNHQYQSMVLGTWQMTELLADPGDGSGRYKPVSGPDKYITFDNKGDVSGEAMPDVKRYQFIDHNRIEFTRAQDFKVIFRYNVTGDQLELIPPCIEACGIRFKRKL